MFKILVLVHYYFKKNKAGGEKYLHYFLKIIKDIYKDKCQITVLLPEKEKIEKYTYDDFIIYETNEKDFLGYIKNCDLVITHLNHSYNVSNYCEKINKKYITIIHSFDTHYNNVIIRPNNIIIYNCYNTYKKYSDIHVFNKNFFIINPYVPYLEYNKHYLNIEDREYITLVNLNNHKGYDVLIELAKHFKNKKFLAVKGGYAQQNVKLLKQYSNIHIIDSTEDMLNNVYLKSRIILMPSVAESYGMVAAEATCLGIPVICSNLDGLKDNLGKIGLYCEKGNINEWIDKINILDDFNTYLLWSNNFLNRAEYNHKVYNSQVELFKNKIIDLI